MIKRDFHGYKLDDALRAVDVIIGETRAKGKLESAEFIVGHGIIQEEIIGLCREYGLDARVSWTNSGVINVLIE